MLEILEHLTIVFVLVLKPEVISGHETILELYRLQRNQGLPHEMMRLLHRKGKRKMTG